MIPLQKTAGRIDNPVGAADYPEKWRRWEREFLDPLIVEDPDEIRFTSNHVVAADEGRVDE